jgi:hypothetical protein
MSSSAGVSIGGLTVGNYYSVEGVQDDPWNGFQLSNDDGATWEPYYTMGACDERDQFGSKHLQFLQAPSWALYAVRNGSVYKTKCYFRATTTAIRLHGSWSNEFTPGEHYIGWELRSAVTSGSAVNAYTAGAIFSSGSFPLNSTSGTGQIFYTGSAPYWSIETTGGPITGRFGATYFMQLASLVGGGGHDGWAGAAVAYPSPFQLLALDDATPVAVAWEMVDQYHPRVYIDSTVNTQPWIRVADLLAGYSAPYGGWPTGGAFLGESGSMGYIIRHATKGGTAGNTRLQISSASLSNVCPNG